MKRIMSLAIGMLAFAFYSTASQAAITSVTVTSATLSKSTGVLTVSGTIQCTAGDSFEVVDIIDQVSGGKSGIAEGFASGTCTGGSDSWSTTQLIVGGSFKNGNADVFVQAIDFTDGSLTPFTGFHEPITPVP